MDVTVREISLKDKKGEYINIQYEMSPELVYIRSLWVRRDMKGRGLGSHAVINFIQIMYDIGVHNISIDCTRSSKKFWKMLGFIFDTGQPTSTMKSFDLMYHIIKQKKSL